MLHIHIINDWKIDIPKKKCSCFVLVERCALLKSSFIACVMHNSENKNFTITLSYYLCSVRRTNWIVA